MANAMRRRMRFSPADSTWYLPFCSACTGSTRAALRAGMNAATMLVTRPIVMANTMSAGVIAIASGTWTYPNTPSSMPLIWPTMPRAMTKPAPHPSADPTRPSTALSTRNSERICARVAPSARRMPMSARRCVTAIAKEL
jgi:hypothetical protein